jgi:hypothetical protein
VRRQSEGFDLMPASEFRRKEGETLDEWEARVLAMTPPPPEADESARRAFAGRRFLALDEIREEREKGMR